MTGGGGTERMARRKLQQARGLKVPSLPSADVEVLPRLEFALAAGITPDPWQELALESNAKKAMWLCCRQAGKSTTAALLASHEAVYAPGSLTLMLAPSLRQSGELFRTCLQILKRVDVQVPDVVAESALRVELENGSRIVALPGSESTTRGYAAATLVLVDECARVADELIGAVRPTLATTDGRIVCLSTPAGKRGFFWAEWIAGVGWERTRVPVQDCPRISAEFLEDERRLLGPHVFGQEYDCDFFDADSQFFSTDLIEAALTEDVAPLWSDL